MNTTLFYVICLYLNKQVYSLNAYYPSLIVKNVDYGRMAEILVRRAGSDDEFTRLTSITWVILVLHAVRNLIIRVLLWHCYIM
jgi:hypothetical protein